MNKKNQITKTYKEKLKKFNNYNKAYFDKDKPLIADHKFDELKKEIIKLEKSYPFLKIKKSIFSSVGYRPSDKFQKIKHSKAMLSLSNAFDKADMLS